MEQSRLAAMMEGKTFTKENIDRMARMVADASSPEEKTKVMKHSVFFVGQLPVKEDQSVDLSAMDRAMGGAILQSELAEYRDKLITALLTQKLLVRKDEGEEGPVFINRKYENSVQKVRRIVSAWQAEKGTLPEDLDEKIKSIYRSGTKYYHAGDYEQAAAAFRETVDLAGYRMGYYSLALMYKDGKGVDRSPEKALCYAREAIGRGARIAEGLEEEILAQMQQ